MSIAAHFTDPQGGAAIVLMVPGNATEMVQFVTKGGIRPEAFKGPSGWAISVKVAHYQKLPKFTTYLQSRNNLEILFQYSPDSDMALLTGRVPTGQLGWARLSSFLFFKQTFNMATRNPPA